MNLSYHILTDDEGRQVCGWHYEGEYACYNQPPYEEVRKKGMMFCNPDHRNNFRSYYDGETLVGFTNLMEEEQTVYLGIGVHPDLCSQGYGTAIIKETCRISQELYPDKPIYLVVRTWNQRAIRCYEKAGFVREGEPFEMRTYSGIGLFYRMIRK